MLRALHDCFHTSSWREKDVLDHLLMSLWIVKSQRHSVHRYQFHRGRIDFEIRIKVG